MLLLLVWESQFEDRWTKTSSQWRSAFAKLSCTPGVLHQRESRSHWLWDLRSYVPPKPWGLPMQLPHYGSWPAHLEKTSPYPVWLLQLLTALRTVTVLCAVRHLLLPDAVFIRLPVPPWASTDPGLKAASAQDLPAGNQRGGKERVKWKRIIKVLGVLSFPYPVPAITHPPSPPAHSWLLWGWTQKHLAEHERTYMPQTIRVNNIPFVLQRTSKPLTEQLYLATDFEGKLS